MNIDIEELVLHYKDTNLHIQIKDIDSGIDLYLRGIGAISLSRPRFYKNLLKPEFVTIILLLILLGLTIALLTRNGGSC